MKRIVAAVITGYFTIGFLVLFTDQIAAWTIPGFTTMTMPPANYLYTSVATDTLYSLIGGFLCSAIAEAGWRTAALSLIVVGELIGLVTQINLWSKVPHWFGLALLVTYPIAVWLGAKLKARMR